MIFKVSRRIWDKIRTSNKELARLCYICGSQFRSNFKYPIKVETPEGEVAVYAHRDCEQDTFKAALNQILMIGSSELAYTSEFTERVLNIAHKALTGKDRGL
jgi:hypothetical protein